MTQLRNTFLFFLSDRGNEKRARFALREKERRTGDEQQLVQEVSTLPTEGMRAIGRAFPQPAPHQSCVHTHVAQRPDMLLRVRTFVCVFQQLSGG